MMREQNQYPAHNFLDCRLAGLFGTGW